RSQKVTPIRAYEGLAAAGRLKDRDWLAASYRPEDRAAIRGTTDAELAKNAELLSNITQQVVEQAVLYKGCGILLLRYTDAGGEVWRSFVVFRKTEGEWFATNELADDELLLGTLQAAWKGSE